MKNKKGITLIALVITIIILIILASVTIYLALGNNGIINKAEQAKNETTKQTATEKMNLKITNIQMEIYSKEQRIPTLQEFSDKLCEDDEIQYIELQSKKVGSLSKIEVGEATSIFTKLKEYPYEFKINSSLQIASINEVKNLEAEDKITISKKEYEELINGYKKTAGVYCAYKKLNNWDDYGFYSNIKSDENICSYENYKVTINKKGKYLIEMLSCNTEGGGTPTFQLYKNDEMVKEYKNNSEKGNGEKSSIILNLEEGDVLQGKEYGGGTYFTVFITTIYELMDETKNSDTGDNITISKEEYEELINGYKKTAGVYCAYKKLNKWDDYGFYSNIESDENICSYENYKVTIDKKGKYLIEMLSCNTEGGGTPTFQLYKNDEMVKEYKNNSEKGNGEKSSIILNLEEGDVLQGKEYGGGTYFTVFTTTIYELCE